ncbi:hypothetical protein KP509_12G060500 [Ceratopteris richardii]|nr:hypothetical protein KP509_12G060500 [Ceratopteris richardii]
MQADHFTPNDHTYVALLKACTDLKAISAGARIHAEISAKSYLACNLHINSTLVHMYATSGLLVKAREIFDSIPDPSIVSWNALVAGYVRHGYGSQALHCFIQMHEAGIAPNEITYVCVLKACGITKALEMGRNVHAEVSRKNLVMNNSIIQGALVDMYAKCGLLKIAQGVFDKLPTRCLITWTALISGYANHGYGIEALDCCEEMRIEGISPNSVTFACSLKACGIVGAKGKGSEIHVEVSQNGLLWLNPVIGNALLSMYINCEMLSRAEEVFKELTSRDVVTWNILIAGYTKYELHEEALDLFNQMIQDGYRPDAVTYIFILKCCGIVRAGDVVIEIHIELARQGLLEKEPEVNNAMVHTYAKCGCLRASQEVFYRSQTQDVVAWTAYILGFIEHNHASEALRCYTQMQLEGVYPNAITYICLLKACGMTKSKCKGQLLHAQIVNNKLLAADPSVSDALIHMYADCGSLSKVKEVLDRRSAPVESLWDSMLDAYANHRHCEKPFIFPDIMTSNELFPDTVTCLSCMRA